MQRRMGSPCKRRASCLKPKEMTRERACANPQII
jgi:hypothetical protein